MAKQKKGVTLLDPETGEELPSDPSVELPVELPGTLIRHIGPNNPKSITLRVQHQARCYTFDRPGNICAVLEPEAVKILLGMKYTIDTTDYPMFEKV